MPATTNATARAHGSWSAESPLGVVVGRGGTRPVTIAVVQTLRRTPLYEKHVEAGARIVPFAGWEMPVQYTGIVDEHQAVRTAAGLFDVSHMGELVLRGPYAAQLVDYLVTNDVKKLLSLIHI